MISVTVAIPCYNGAPYIGQCIQAILGQTRKPDVIFVIDDGCSDDSASIIAQYPVQLIRHEHNMGLSAARNTALQHTQTELLAFVDTDAYADENMLQVLINEFENDEVDGAGGQGIEAVQKTIYDRWRKLHASQGHGPRRKEGCAHLFGLCMAYRRQALLDVGGFSAIFRTNGEDMDAGFRLTQAGHHLVYNPQAYVCHQRKDDHASLRRMMYQWYYWAFIAKKKNGRAPWSLALGTLRRMLWRDTVSDLIHHHSLPLTKLDVELSIVKLQAILAAAHHQG